jgi:hypothetical protein
VIRALRNRVLAATYLLEGGLSAVARRSAWKALRTGRCWVCLDSPAVSYCGACNRGRRAS